jgi:hypothetical protein
MKWILGIVLLVSTICGLYFFIFNAKNDNAKKDKNGSQITDNKSNVTPPIVTGTVEKTNSELPEVPFMVYTFIAEEGATIKDLRSGAMITIPANILINKNGALITGPVILKYREFRNQADIALSNIPMVYKGQNFNSAGMFEILALQKEDTLGIKNNGNISIDFVMTKNDPGIGFYALNDASKQWQFIRSLDKGNEKEGEKFAFIEDGFGFTNGTGNVNIKRSLKDAFVRSLGYQKLAIERENIIPELPSKPKGDFTTLFEDEKYKQIAGSDTNASNHIEIKEIDKQFKKAEKESGFTAFFKRMFLTGGTLTIPINSDKAPKVDTSLSIAVKDRRYTIYENGQDIVMTELASLKGSQFIYDGDNVFDNLTKVTFYDVRLTRDTTVLNRFYLELKTDGEIVTFQLRLSKPDFTSFTEYKKQQRMRMLTYDNRVKLKEKEYQDLIQLRQERTKLLDSVSLYGNENIFRMARLIMTEDELKMSQEEWFASLDTSKSLRKRIDAHLDSIAEYGDNADQYIDKLAKERKQNIRKNELNQERDQQLLAQANMDAGHYFNPLVCNLKIKGFGVYNCDQVYAIQNPITVRAAYITEDSMRISELRAISLIDPKVNAAFSFSATLFTCSSSGDNMVLLFTTDNKIYFFDKAKWKAKQIKKGGAYTFVMKDITSLVKSSADLQRILEKNLL